MEKFNHEKEIKEIPLKDLYIDKAQVRKENIGKGIKELADNIREIGLIEPITVTPANDEGKYEIITGQRRFLAHQELKAKTIKAVVLERQVDEVEAKVLSLSENMLREDLSRKDLTDVCTFLYKRYGSIKDVSKETGLPYYKVSKYVKYDRLIPELKKMVDEGIDVNTAIKAQDAASVTGEVEKKVAIKFAKEMKVMSNEQRKRIVEERQMNPEGSIDEIIETAKSGAQIYQIRIQIGPETNRALQIYAREEQISPEEAVTSLIEEQLRDGGYLK